MGKYYVEMNMDTIIWQKVFEVENYVDYTDQSFDILTLTSEIFKKIFEI